ncbi:MAG: hypothetical protein JST40_09765 [Armatimonadetes bacterium]|nr:hypothetical protein [Armatimonadota bacterium]
MGRGLFAFVLACLLAVSATASELRTVKLPNSAVSMLNLDEFDEAEVVPADDEWYKTQELYVLFGESDGYIGQIMAFGTINRIDGYLGEYVAHEFYDVREHVGFKFLAQERGKMGKAEAYKIKWVEECDGVRQISTRIFVGSARHLYMIEMTYDDADEDAKKEAERVVASVRYGNQPLTELEPVELKFVN